MKRSNCHLEAWRRYRRGEAAGFCLRPTHFSKAEKFVKHPLSLPIRLLGMLLQWTCWPLTHVGEMLRTGRWYHVTWFDHQGRRWEYVMTDDAGEFDDRTRAWFPPLIFRGKVQPVSEGTP